MRLAYLVVGLVAGFGLWSSPWAPPPVRAFVCSTAVVTGAVAAWGRWRGRALDGWVADLCLFVISTRRLVLDWRWLQRFRLRNSRRAPVLQLRHQTLISVSGRAPRAGATTVAAELAACLAVKGYPTRALVGARRSRVIPASRVLRSRIYRLRQSRPGRVCYLIVERDPASRASFLKTNAFDKRPH